MYEVEDKSNAMKSGVTLLKTNDLSDALAVVLSGCIADEGKYPDRVLAGYIDGEYRPGKGLNVRAIINEGESQSLYADLSVYSTFTHLTFTVDINKVFADGRQDRMARYRIRLY